MHRRDDLDRHATYDWPNQHCSLQHCSRMKSWKCVNDDSVQDWPARKKFGEIDVELKQWLIIKLVSNLRTHFEARANAAKTTSARPKIDVWCEFKWKTLTLPLDWGVSTKTMAINDNKISRKTERKLRKHKAHLLSLWDHFYRVVIYREKFVSFRKFNVFWY